MVGMNGSQIDAQRQHPPGAENLDAALVTAMETTLTRYFRTIRHMVEQAAQAERLTLAQYRCLQAIAAQGTTLTTQLALQMRVTLPTITSRIDGLVERGLVERQPDPRSRRQVQLSLTPAGRAALDSYQAMMNAWLRLLLSPLDAIRKQRLLAALGDLGVLLESAGTSPMESEATPLEREQ